MKRMSLLLLLAAPLHAQEPPEDPRRELARSEAEERKVLDELNTLDQQVVEVEQQIEELRGQADEVERQWMTHQDELGRVETALHERRERTGRLVRHLYRLHHRGFAWVLFSAEDPSDLRRRSYYLTQIVRALEAATRAYRDEVAKQRAALARVDADRSAMAAVTAELRLKEARLRDEYAQRAGLLDEIRSDRSKALRALAERGDTARALGEQIVATTTVVETAVSFPRLHGQLALPVSGGKILRRYGDYIDPTTNTTARNLGIDISAALHTPIRAVADGAVTFQRFLPGYGLTIVVAHGDYATVYAHCGTVRVRQGEVVKKDQVIGTVGTTGVTDDLGPRVHFEVRYHNTPQDPTPWLRPG